MKVFFEKDCPLEPIQGKNIGILGYGNQGRAQALCLKDSGLTLKVGLAAGSPSRELAQADGIIAETPAELASWADVLLFLVPDEVQGLLYENELKPFLREGVTFGFAHGFNLHFNKISLPAGSAAFLVAPKGPGVAVRANYLRGVGTPCLVAVNEESAWPLAFAYARAIGGGKGGLLKTTFKEETECDLFGEQAVLCGGLPRLIQMSFDVLVKNGFSPEMAYFECLHETKLIADLLYKEGIAGMKKRISNTAEFGSYMAETAIFDDKMESRLQKILTDIQSGAFAQSFLHEMQEGQSELIKTRRKEDSENLLEGTGQRVREIFGFNA